MRAAYIAAMNGKQTAVLAPTTVLAEQHFETFTSRFDGTPIRIESVSRFQSAATHTGTFRRIATGACDIVIGTHAILSSKIAFRDLGLIIIDEEQRFGVRHKAFLKHLRATADVLTLSATPIPRTLYLSMTGARDLSLLRTPPRERVAVDTKIVRDSPEVIRAAVEAELARGGQVFFLHNRVTTIGKTEKYLAQICPGARIVVAHGQMDAKTLARKMRDFESGKFDILLSTTIVESGIDIPRANTILVDHAEMFGLADLYPRRAEAARRTRLGLQPRGARPRAARRGEPPRLAAVGAHRRSRLRTLLPAPPANRRDDEGREGSRNRRGQAEPRLHRPIPLRLGRRQLRGASVRVRRGGRAAHELPQAPRGGDGRARRSRPRGGA